METAVGISVPVVQLDYWMCTDCQYGLRVQRLTRSSGCHVKFTCRPFCTCHPSGNSASRAASHGELVVFFKFTVYLAMPIHVDITHLIPLLPVEQ